MKRLIALLALLAGGLGTEAVKPVNCQLICDTRVLRVRPRPFLDN
jgi:hypothetical protein